MNRRVWAVAAMILGMAAAAAGGPVAGKPGKSGGAKGTGIQGERPAIENVAVPVPAILRSKPKPTMKVLHALPTRHTIAFADWLKLFGSAYEGGSDYPAQSPPFSGEEGDGTADPKTGDLEIAVPNPGLLDLYYTERSQSIYWDFTYNGTDILDVNLAALFTSFQPLTVVYGDDSSGGGGGMSEVIAYLTAVDKTDGRVSEQVFYDELKSGGSTFPYTRKYQCEPCLALRLQPGHQYRFSVRAYGSTQTWTGSVQTGKMRGVAQAWFLWNLKALYLVPTDGPRVEATVLTVFPTAYDTYDLYESILGRTLQKQYFPVAGEIQFSIGGQYAAAESFIRITLAGGGKLSLFRPNLVTGAGFTVNQAADHTIHLVPPPPAGLSLGTHCLNVPVLIDAEFDPNKMKLSAGDRVLEPLKRMWMAMDFRLPDKPKLIVPNNRLVNLMDVTYYYVIMPADQAGVEFTRSGLKAAKPVPVLYAAPPGSRAAPPNVPGWAVKTVPWATLAPPALRGSGAPLVAVNVAALADLYADLAECPAEGPGARKPAARGSLKRIPARDAAKAPADVVKPDRPVLVKPKAEPRGKRGTGSFVLCRPPGSRGYYTGDPWNQQVFIDNLNAMLRRWIKDAQIALKDRSQLVLYVDETGKVITGESLLEELGERKALAAMTEAYDERKENRPLLVLYKASDGEYITGEGLIEDIHAGTVKPPRRLEDRLRIFRDINDKIEPTRKDRIILMVPHLNLYGQKMSLQVKGVAANGPFAKSTAEDEKDFTVYFDFVPRRPAVVIPLIPVMPGLPNLSRMGAELRAGAGM